MDEIVKIEGKLYRLGTISPLISIKNDKYVYYVYPLKPTEGINPMFERALATADEFEELSPIEKVLYGK